MKVNTFKSKHCGLLKRWLTANPNHEWSEYFSGRWFLAIPPGGPQIKMLYSGIGCINK